MKNKLKDYASYCFRIIVSSSLVRKITKLIHINKIGKSFYFKFFAPKDKKVSLEVDQLKAQFFVRNYTELIYLTETVVGVGDERKIIKLLLESIAKGDVVYDVGSFIGLHAIFFAKKVGSSGKVVAFEPSLDSLKALMSNAKLNSIDNIIPLDIALGKEKKDAILRGNDSSMYSLSDQFGDVVFNQKTIIMPGDLVAKEKNLPDANIVKIDVEGYEYEVIKGLEKTLKNSNCKLVCCELHPTLLPKDVNIKMVIDLLKSYGFGRIDIYERGLTSHAFCYKV